MLVFFFFLRKRSALGAARAQFLGRQATMLVGWGSPRSHYGPSVRDSAASGVGEGCEGRKWRERTGGDRKIWWRVAAGKGNGIEWNRHNEQEEARKGERGQADQGEIGGTQGYQWRVRPRHVVQHICHRAPSYILSWRYVNSTADHYTDYLGTQTVPHVRQFSWLGY